MRITEFVVHQKDFPCYPVFVGNDILGSFSDLFMSSKYSKVVVLFDENLKGIAENLAKQMKIKTFLVNIPGHDDSKEINFLRYLWEKFITYNVDRSSLIVNLGGGVVLDIGGFAAATFKRGVDYINIPSTLLSQVDSCIGGKTGINLKEVKNVVGVIKPPVGVLVNTVLLKSLPVREIRSGLAEVLKYSLIFEPGLMDRIQGLDLSALLEGNVKSDELLEEIILRSLECKNKILQQEISEPGIRDILNFGHTIGHALESYSWTTKNPLLHGEAIAIGMIGESYISAKRGYISLADLKLIEDLVLKVGLPTRFELSENREDEFGKIMKIVRNDKKNENEEISLVILEKLGKAKYGNKVEEMEILDGLGSLA